MELVYSDRDWARRRVSGANMMVADGDPCCLSLGPSPPLGGSLDLLSVIAVWGPALKLGVWK